MKIGKRQASGHGRRQAAHMSYRSAVLEQDAKAGAERAYGSVIAAEAYARLCAAYGMEA